MSVKDITKTLLNEQNEVIDSILYRVYFESGVLKINKVTVVDDNEVETLVMEQPWKCLADGSREEFVDDNDAFDWLESVKNMIL
jgi:hypothetical protein